MATILCVLYDDPVDGYPSAYARDGIPAIERYPDGQTTPSPEAIDFTPGPAARKRVGRARAAQVPRGARAPARRHLRQGRAGLGVRARAARGGRRDLAAVLARLPDRRADREGAEPEARADRGDRLRPRRPAGGDRQRDHRHRGHLLQQHQRRRARGHGDPRARAQLPPRRTRSSTTAAGTSPTASRGRTTSRGCRSAPSPRGGSARRCCAGSSRSTSACTTPTGTGCPAEVEEELGVTFHPDVESLVEVCDVVTINAPLHPETEHLFDEAMIGADEARRVPRQHGARQDLRPRRRRARVRERPARRLRGRRLVPAAGSAGPPVAVDAKPRA